VYKILEFIYFEAEPFASRKGAPRYPFQSFPTLRDWKRISTTIGASIQGLVRRKKIQH